MASRRDDARKSHENRDLCATARAPHENRAPAGERAMSMQLHPEHLADLLAPSRAGLTPPDIDDLRVYPKDPRHDDHTR